MPRRGDIGGWILAGLGLALLLGERGGGGGGGGGGSATTRTDPRGHRTPRGPERPALRLGRYAATREGRCAFVSDVVRILTDVGLSGRSAVLFAAHLGRECGFGNAMWNYNAGNVKQFDTLWPGAPWHRLSNGEPFRAFDSLPDGVVAALDVVRRGRRYARAWELLLAGDPLWYSELGIAGYYELRPGVGHTAETVGPAQASYDRALASARACAAGRDAWDDDPALRFGNTPRGGGGGVGGGPVEGEESAT